MDFDLVAFEFAPEQDLYGALNSFDATEIARIDCHPPCSVVIRREEEPHGGDCRAATFLVYLLLHVDEAAGYVKPEAARRADAHVFLLGRLPALSLPRNMTRP